MSKNKWNTLARTFEDSVCDITTTSGDLLDELVERTRPSKRKTLVDAGCGIGSFVKRFGRRFDHVVAFDFASQMVVRARKRCTTLKHVEWHSLPLEDASDRFGPIADLAVSLNVITSTDAALRRRQWASLSGLAKPGGHVLVVLPSVESARYVLKFADTASPSARDAKQGHIVRTDDKQKHYDRDELRDVVAANNMRVLSLRRIHYPWAEEGMEEDEIDLPTRTPWDWVCLVKRRLR